MIDVLRDLAAGLWGLQRLQGARTFSLRWGLMALFACSTSAPSYTRPSFTRYGGIPREVGFLFGYFHLHPVPRSLECVHNLIVFFTCLCTYLQSPELKPLLRLAWNKQDPNYLTTIMADSAKTFIIGTSPKAHCQFSFSAKGSNQWTSVLLHSPIILFKADIYTHFAFPLAL